MRRTAQLVRRAPVVPTVLAPPCGRPSSVVGMRWVFFGPVATAMALIAQARAAKIATRLQPSLPVPARAAAMVGVKPARPKPNWVPTAIPESRTLVGKYSAYVAGHTALVML